MTRPTAKKGFSRLWRMVVLCVVMVCAGAMAWGENYYVTYQNKLYRYDGEENDYQVISEAIEISSDDFTEITDVSLDNRATIESDAIVIVPSNVEVAMKNGWTNDGKIVVYGTLTTTSTFTNNGTIEIKSGGSLVSQNNTVNSGMITIDEDGSFSSDGFTNESTGVITNNGSVSLVNSVNNGGTITNSGSLSSTGTITNSGTIGANIDNSGEVINEGDLSGNVSGTPVSVFGSGSKYYWQGDAHGGDGTTWTNGKNWRDGTGNTFATGNYPGFSIGTEVTFPTSATVTVNIDVTIAEFNLENAVNIVFSGSGTITTGNFDGDEGSTETVTIENNVTLIVTETLWGDGDLTFINNGTLLIPGSGANLDYKKSVNIKYEGAHPVPYSLPDYYEVLVNGNEPYNDIDDYKAETAYILNETFPAEKLTLTFKKPENTNQPVAFPYRIAYTDTDTSYHLDSTSLSSNTTGTTGSIELTKAVASKDDTFALDASNFLAVGKGFTITIKTPDGAFTLAKITYTQPAHAWTGATDTAWEKPANWNFIPAGFNFTTGLASEDISVGKVDSGNYPTISAPTLVNSLAFTDDATLAIDSDGELTLTDKLTSESVVVNSGTITLGTGASAFNGGVTNSGTITCGSGNIVFNGAVINNGTLTAGTGAVTFNDDYLGREDSRFIASSGNTIFYGNADFSFMDADYFDAAAPAGTMYFITTGKRLTTCASQSFSTLYLGGTSTLDIGSGGASVSNLRMHTDSAVVPYLTANSSVTVTGASTLTCSSVLEIERISETADEKGTLTIDCSVVTAAKLYTHSGTNVIVNAGKTLTIAAFQDASDATNGNTITVHGTLNASGVDMPLSLNSALTVETDGTLLAANITSADGNANVITNKKTLSISGSIADASSVVNNAMLISAGGISATSITNTGAITLQGGINAALSFGSYSGSDTGADSVVFSGGGKLISTSATSVSIGTLNAAGTTSCTGISDLTIGTNLKTAYGFTVDSGSLTVNGTTDAGYNGSITTGGSQTYNGALTLGATVASTVRLVSSESKSLALADVEIKANNTLAFGSAAADDYDVTVSGNWTNNGTLTANQSTVTFRGNASISGNSTFYNFTDAAAGTTLEVSGTQTVSNTLTLSGTSGDGNLLTVTGTGAFNASTASGRYNGQYLSVGNDIQIQNEGVLTPRVFTAEDSALADGATLSSVVAHGWKMLDCTYTWNGGNSTSWDLASNWNEGVSPDETGRVVYVSNVINHPALDSDVTVAQITIPAGASLSLNSHDFTISSAFTNYGTVYVQGAETITIGGTVIENGTWHYAGTSETDTVKAVAWLQYNKLIISGTISIASGYEVTATNGITLGTADGVAMITGNQHVVFADDVTLAGDVTLESGTGKIMFESDVAISVGKTLTLGSDAEDAYTVSVAGDWTNNGTLAPQKSTITFTGAGKTVSGNQTFATATFSGNGITLSGDNTIETATFSGASQTVSGNNTITTATFSGTGTTLSGNNTFATATFSADATISGNNTYTNFTCVAPEKTLTVNGTQTVSGKLMLAGGDGNLLSLAGTGQFVTGTSAERFSGEYLSVGSSLHICQTAGSLVAGAFSVANSQPTVASDEIAVISNGWKLGTVSFTWTGEASAAWETAANWNPAFVPGSANFEDAIVTIPDISAAANYPATAAAYTVQSLVIGTAGAAAHSATLAVGNTFAVAGTAAGTLTNYGTISLSAHDVSVAGTDALTNSGTIRYAGSGRITDDATPINDVANGGTVEYSGGTAGSPQVVTDFGETDYANLVVSGVAQTETAIRAGGNLTVNGMLSAEAALTVTGGLSLTGNGTVSLNAANGGQASTAGTFSCEMTGGTLSFGNEDSDSFAVTSGGISLSSEVNAVLAGRITTEGGAQSYGGAVTLRANANVETSDKNVSFGGTVENADGGAFSLTVSQGSGATSFTGAVGTEEHPLGALSSTGSGSVQFDGAVYAESLLVTGASVIGADITTAGAQTYTGNVTVNGGTVSAGGAIAFNGNVTNSGTIIVPALATDTVAVTFGGVYDGTDGNLVGAKTPDSDITPNPTIEFKGDVTFGTFRANGDRVLFSGDGAVIAGDTESGTEFATAQFTGDGITLSGNNTFTGAAEFTGTTATVSGNNTFASVSLPTDNAMVTFGGTNEFTSFTSSGENATLTFSEGNEFGTLSVTGAGTTARFGAGKTQKVTTAFTSRGADGSRATLTTDADFPSADKATWWTLDIPESVGKNADFAYTLISYSESAQDIAHDWGATVSETDGMTENWFWHTFYWTGATDGAWEKAANWSYAADGEPASRAPSATSGFDEVVVSTKDGGTSLALSVPINLKSLEVRAEKSLDAAGKTVTVTQAITNGGTITAGGATFTAEEFNNNGTLRLTGAETITAAMRNGAGSTVEYYGTELSALPWAGDASAGGKQYENLVFAAGSGGTVGDALTVNGTASFGNGNALTLSGANTFAGNVNITGSGALSLSAANDFDGAVSIATAGDVTLSGTNIFAGGVVIASGGEITLNSVADFALGNTETPISCDSLHLTGAHMVTVKNVLLVTNALSNTGTLVAGGAISASELTNNGTVTLGGNTLSFGSYTGATDGTDVIRLAGGSITSTDTGGTIGTIQSSGSFTLSDGDSGALVISSYEKTGADEATATINGGTAGITISSATYRGSAVSTSGRVTLAGTTGEDSAGAVTILNGTALTSGNLVSGEVTVSAGSLTLGGDTSASSVTIGSGATLSAGSEETDTHTVTVTGALTNNGMFIARAGAVTVGGEVSNNGTFTCGSGAIEFNGDVTNSGTITVPALSNDTTALTFGGAYLGTDGTLVGAKTSDSDITPNPTIEFKGKVTFGTFRANGDKVLFSGDGAVIAGDTESGTAFATAEFTGAGIMLNGDNTFAAATFSGNTTFGGSNTFASFSCTPTESVTLTFKDSTTQTITGADAGSLTLTGTAENRLNLAGSGLIVVTKSAFRGENLSLGGGIKIEENEGNLVPGAFTVEHSVPAGGVAAISVIRNGWKISALAFTWNGSKGSSWNNAENWDVGIVPGTENFTDAEVTIPDGLTVYPATEDAYTVQSLVIGTAGAAAHSASLAVGNTFAVAGTAAGSLTNYGTIRYAGSGRITADATAINDTTHGGTVEYSGGTAESPQVVTDFGDTDYANLVVSGVAKTETAISAGGSVTVSGGLMAGEALSASGNITVGSTGGLTAKKTLSASGDITVNGTLETDGALTVTGGLSLTGNGTVSLNAANGGQASTAGTFSCEMTGGTLSFGNEDSDSFAVTSGGISLPSEVNAVLAGTITSAGGAQSYGGAVTLRANANVKTSGGGVSFGGTVENADGGAFLLTVSQGSGTVSFAGAVGTEEHPLGALSSTGSGSVQFDGAVHAGSVAISGASVIGAGITTAGAQTYTGAVRIAGTTVAFSSGGDISFKSAIDGTEEHAQSVVFAAKGTDSEKKKISVAGAVGGTVALGDISFKFGDVTLGGDTSASSVTIGSGATVSAGGAIAFNGDVTNSGTITVPALSDDTTALTFGGAYLGTGGSLVGAKKSDSDITPNPTIEFKGKVTFGTFRANGDKVLFSGDGAVIAGDTESGTAFATAEFTGAGITLNGNNSFAGAVEFSGANATLSGENTFADNVTFSGNGSIISGGNTFATAQFTGDGITLGGDNTFTGAAEFTGTTATVSGNNTFASVSLPTDNVAVTFSGTNEFTSFMSSGNGATVTFSEGNEFGTLSVTGGGTTLTFAGGTTQTVSGTGADSFTLAGEAGNLLVLASSGNGMANLVVSGGAEKASAKYLAIGTGVSIAATAGSVAEGAFAASDSKAIPSGGSGTASESDYVAVYKNGWNLSHAFTFVWQGDDSARSNDWNVAENWDIGIVPGVSGRNTTASVIIPEVVAGAGYPVLSSDDITVASLAIVKSESDTDSESSATLTLGTGALTVTGNAARSLTNRGTVTISAGDLRVTGTADGAFANNGTITITESGTAVLSADAAENGTWHYKGAVFKTVPQLSYNKLILSGNVTVLATVSATNGIQLGTETQPLVVTGNTESIIFASPVTLANTATLSADAEHKIDFESTVNGTHALTVGGNAEFSSAAGGETPLGAVTVNGNLTTEAALTAESLAVTGASTIGGNVTTTGTQTYTGATTLTADITAQGGGAILFGSTVGGTHGLTLITDAGTTFSGAAGTEEHPLGALSSTGSGSVQFDGAVYAESLLVTGASVIGADITTAGAQTYTGAATIAGSAGTVSLIVTDGTEKTISFGSSLEIASGKTLQFGSGGTDAHTVTVAGDVTNAGTVTGGASALSLAGNWTNDGTFMGGAGALSVGGALTNTGAFVCGAGAVTVDGITTNTGTFTGGSGALTFNGSYSGAGTLTASSGAVTFAGNADFGTGSFTASSATTSFAGNADFSEATFTHNGGTVRFSGDNATVAGNTTTGTAFATAEFTGTGITVDGNNSFAGAADFSGANATLSGANTFADNVTFSGNTTFGGSNTFASFRCETGGATITLANDAVQTVSGTADGSLTLRGTESAKLSLAGSGQFVVAKSAFTGKHLSVGDGIKIMESAGTLVAGAFTVSDSAPASEGTMVTVTANGWKFGAMAFEWTGVTSAAWETAANWSPTFVPGSANFQDAAVTIPDISDTANYPAVTAAYTVGSVTVGTASGTEHNATLTVGAAFSATGSFTNYGTMTVADATSVTVGSALTNNGTITAGGGTFTAESFANNGTLRLTGAETITAAMANGAGSTVEYSGANLSSLPWDGDATAGGKQYENLVFAAESGGTVSDVLSVSGTARFGNGSALTLSAANTFAGEATISNGAGSTLTLAGANSFAAVVTIDSAGDVSLTGANTFGGGIVLSSAGSITLNGADTIALKKAAAATEMTCAALTLQASATTDGALTATDTLSLADGKTLTAGGAVAVGGGISNGGTIAAGGNALSFASYAGKTDATDRLTLSDGGSARSGAAAAVTIGTMQTAGAVSVTNGGTGALTVSSYVNAGSSTAAKATLSGGTGGIALTAATYGGAAVSTSGTVTLAASTGEDACGALRVTGGTTTLSGALSAASLGISADSTLAATDALSVTGAATNEGNFTGGTTVTLGSTLENTGTFAAGTGTFSVGGNVTNTGTITLADGDTSFSAAFTNSSTGTLNAGAGMFAVTGILTNAGTITGGAGALTVAGTTENAGTITLGAGSAEFAGAYSGNGTLTASSTTTAFGADANFGTATFKANGGAVLFMGENAAISGNATEGTTFSTATFSGASQTISGNNTFATATFSGANQTISGNNTITTATFSGTGTTISGSNIFGAATFAASTTFSGSNEFASLACETGGVTLTFADGTEQKVSGTGARMLALKGTDDASVTLATGGTATLIVPAGSAAVSVEKIVIATKAADGSGIQIAAESGKVISGAFKAVASVPDGTSPTNADYIAAYKNGWNLDHAFAFVWTGGDTTSPTDWNTAANWDIGIVPGLAVCGTETATVTIPDSVASGKYPMVAGAVTIHTLSVGTATDSAAEISMGTAAFTVTDAFTNYGTVRQTGAETTMIGGAFTNYGTVNYGGSGRITSNGTTEINDAAHGGTVEYSGGTAESPLSMTNFGSTGYANLVISGNANATEQITTSGNVTVSGAANLGAGLTAAGDVTIGTGAALKSDGNVAIGGKAAFGGAVQAKLLAVSGTAEISGGTVTTADGGQQYGGDVTLAADTAFSTTGGGIIFSGVLDAGGEGGQNLTFTANSVSLDGAIGGTKPLGTIRLVGATPATYAGNMYVSSLVIESTASLTAKDAADITPTLTVTGTTENAGTITLGAGSAEFTGAYSGNGTLTASSGETSFRSGADFGTGTFTASSTTTAFGGDVNFSMATFETNGGAVLFTGENAAISGNATDGTTFSTATFSGASQTVSGNNTFATATFSGNGITLSGDNTIETATFSGANQTISGNNTIATATFSGTGTTLSGNNIFGAAIFNGDTALLGSNEFATFTAIGSDTVLTFGAGKTQTVTDSFEVRGQENHLVTLKSSENGSRWTIDVPLDKTKVFYAKVSDSHSVYDSIFAENSVNNGNNINWNFLEGILLPEITMMLSPVGGNQMYAIFSRQITYDSKSFDDLSLSEQKEALEMIPDNLVFVTTGGNPSSGVQTDWKVESAEHIATGKDYTVLLLHVNRKIKLDDIRNLSIYIKFMVRDDTNHAHALSDFALNVVTPLYAYADGILDDSNAYGSRFVESHAVRDFTADSSEVLRSEADITVQTRIISAVNGENDYVAASDVSAELIPDLKTNLRSSWISDVVNERIGSSWRVWLSDKMEHLASGYNTSPQKSVSGTAVGDSAGLLWNFTLPNLNDNPERYGWKGGDEVQFVFKLFNSDGKPIEIDLDGTGKKVPLYALSMPKINLRALPFVDLWSFRLKDAAKQRGGVTIQNNVINVNEKEQTIIQVDMPSEGNLNIYVMTLDGNIVQRLEHGRISSGTHFYTWNGTNTAGNPVARGLYFVRVVGNGIDETRKVMCVKE